MTVLTEGKLQLTISNAVAARKFDDASHKLSHCMKAVDFVVELSDHYLFILLFLMPLNAPRRLACRIRTRLIKAQMTMACSSVSDASPVQS